jgi:hypothetical protein
VHNVTLKIPVMGPQGNINKGYDTADGLYIQFNFTPKGLEMNQQSWPFES